MYNLEKTIVFIYLILQKSVADNLEKIKSCQSDVREDFGRFYNTQENIEGVTFCLLNDFDCFVENPVEFSKIDVTVNNSLLNWKCYFKEFTKLEYEITPNQTYFEISEKLQFNISYLNSFPKPFSIFTLAGTNISSSINDSLNESYEIEIQHSGTYSLKMFQPGLNGNIEIMMDIKLKENSEDTSNLVIILCTVIPSVIGLIGLIFAYVCYKKQWLCYKARPSNSTNGQGMSNISSVASNVETHPQSPGSNPGYIDDTNFTEIDLQDGGQNQNSDGHSPMASYIANVAAR